MQAFACHPVSSIHIPLRSAVCPVPHTTELFSVGSQWETMKPANRVHPIFTRSHVNVTPLTPNTLQTASLSSLFLCFVLFFFLSRFLLLPSFPALSSLKIPHIHPALPPWWFSVSALDSLLTSQPFPGQSDLHFLNYPSLISLSPFTDFYSSVCRYSSTLHSNVPNWLLDISAWLSSVWALFETHCLWTGHCFSSQVSYLRWRTVSVDLQALNKFGDSTLMESIFYRVCSAQGHVWRPWSCQLWASLL